MELTPDQTRIRTMILHMIKHYSCYRDYYEAWTECRRAAENFVRGTITSEDCVAIICNFDQMKRRKSRKLVALLNDMELLELTYEKRR